MVLWQQNIQVTYVLIFSKDFMPSPESFPEPVFSAVSLFFQIAGLTACRGRKPLSTARLELVPGSLYPVSNRLVACIRVSSGLMEEAQPTLIFGPGS